MRRARAGRRAAASSYLTMDRQHQRQHIRRYKLWTLAVVLHSKDAERFHGTGSNLRLRPLEMQGKLLVWGR